MDELKKAELQKRRKQRILQVREQSKVIASELRDKVNSEKKRKAEEFAKIKCKELREWQEQQLRDMKNQCSKNYCDLGNAHKAAEAEVDPREVLKDNKTKRDNIAQARGKEAMKNLKEEIIQKHCKQKTKQKTFRSVPTSNVPKIKITHIIKKVKKSAIKDDCVCYDDPEVELGTINLDKNASDPVENSLLKTDDDHNGHYTNSISNKNGEKVSHTPYLSELRHNGWFCQCCKMQRDVGIQCLCPKTSYEDDDKETSSDAISLDKDGSEANNYFTQVSDRIKSRKIIDVPSLKVKSSVYNPQNFSDNVLHRNDSDLSDDFCDKIRQPNPRRQNIISSPNKGCIEKSPIAKKINISHGDSSPIRNQHEINPQVRKHTDIDSPKKQWDVNPESEGYRAISPLTAISAKIHDGIICAKNCLEDIEPQVLELQKNVQSLEKSFSEKPVIPISPIKSVKHTNSRISSSTADLPKVKLYDCSTKYEATYRPSSNPVEKVDSHFSNAHDVAQKESENFDKEISQKAQKRRDAMAKSKIRSREALNQARNTKNLENINKCFESLALLERETDTCQNPSLYNPLSYKDMNNQRQERIDEAFSNMLDKSKKTSKNVITLDRIRSNKSVGRKNPENNFTKSSSYSKAGIEKKQSSLNVANLDRDSICNKKIIDICCGDDKSSTTSSSIMLGNLDHKNIENQDLKELLERVKRQKQMLLEEVPKENLPQDSKLNDVLIAMEKSLSDPLEESQKKTEISSKIDDAQKIKKQKKKLAKKEEELKLKELQLDLLMQKYKLNELEQKTESGKHEHKVPLPENIPIESSSVIPIADTKHEIEGEVIEKQSSDGLEIVIHVKDKSNKKIAPVTKKFSVQTRGPSVIQKHKKSKTRVNKSKIYSPMKNSSYSCSSSSTSYLSPPAELTNVSNFQNISQAFVNDYTSEQFQRQTNKENFISAKSPTKSITSSRFDRTARKKEKPKINPLLASYINRLLLMDRNSIDALTVSSCSDVPTPSDSIINIPSNTVDDKFKINSFEKSDIDTTPVINIESTPSNFNTKRKHVELRKSVQAVEETPKHLITLHNKGIQVSTIHNSSCEESPSPSFYKSNEQSPESLDKNEGMQDFTENCNKRITDLTNLINKVRLEKMKLLECSISSSGSCGQNSTEYLELPSQIQPAEIVDRDNRDDINRTAEGLKHISQETPPQMEITDELVTVETINFTPMLQDIPKPSAMQNVIAHQPFGNNNKNIEHDLTDLRQNMVGINSQLVNLENYMEKIHEYIGDVVKHKPKPPVSLLRQMKNNVNIDTAQAHELSAIMEVDTKVSETAVEIEALQDSLQDVDIEQNSNSLKMTFQGKSQTQDSGDSVTFGSQIKNLFDNTDINITLKSPSKFQNTSADNNLEVKPFPTFEEYYKKLNSKKDVLVNDAEISSEKNEETLPDVMSELLRRNILQRPFDNDTQNSDVTTTDLQEASQSQIIRTPENSNGSVSLLSNSSMENSTSSSTSQEFEKALHKLGMNWALNTLKKTQKSIAHSSSSSIEYPSSKTNYLTNKIIALKNLNEQTLKELEKSHKPLASNITVESSVTESDGKIKKVAQNTECYYNYDGKSQKEDIKALVKKAQNLSLDKESLFRRLLSTSRDLSNNTDNLTRNPSSQTNQRTSTPVFNEKKLSNSSKANSLNETLFSGSNISSVKSNSSDNTHDFNPKRGF